MKGSHLDQEFGIPGDNIRTYSIEEISRQVKSTLDDAFGRIRIRGEISSVSLPRSGHVYLTFKQERHELAAVMWKSKAARLPQPPQEGIEYVATGNLTAYSGSSKYQLIVDSLEPAGEGALLAMIEKRRIRLQAEGLFDREHKQALPYLPGLIGVITSPGGAVIRDILHVLRQRFPRHVVLWPVAVQGQNCAGEVAAAIRGFNRLDPGSAVPRPDLLIVARGGGSMEDLLGFSEEEVVRAAFESRIPLISAVGHETDTPLIDLAADHRSPTPSAAAERAVPVRSELLANVQGLGSRLTSGTGRVVSGGRERLGGLSRGLPKPERLTDFAAQRLDSLSGRLPSALRAAIQEQQLQFGRLAGRVRAPSGVQRAESNLSGLTARLRPGLVRSAIGQGREQLASRAGRLQRRIGQTVGRESARLRSHSRLLESLGYHQVLGRGFAVVRDGDEVLVSRAQAAARGRLDIEFHDGQLEVLNPER